MVQEEESKTKPTPKRADVGGCHLCGSLAGHRPFCSRWSPRQVEMAVKDELRRILEVFDNGFNGEESIWGFTPFDTRKSAKEVRASLEAIINAA